MIVANTWFKKDWGLWLNLIVLPAMQLRQLSLPAIDESLPVTAHVNHGRWLVTCECGGAEYVWEEGLMMCMSCLNAGYGHRLRRTVFPKSRTKIEGLLLVRPIPNRNWDGETVKQMKAENKAHELELIGV